jgi:hypothetical protein
MTAISGEEHMQYEERGEEGRVKKIRKMLDNSFSVGPSDVSTHLKWDPEFCYD